MQMLTGRADAPVRPDERLGPAILGSTLTVTIAAFTTLAARLFVRVRVIRNVGWDDYVMISAMLLCVAGQCIIIPQVHYGAGRHIEYIDPKDFSIAFKLNFITQPLYLFAIGLVKISVGFFLLRIAVKPFYKKIIISIMAFMGFYTIGCFFTIVLQCTDLRVMWDPTVKGTCWPGIALKTLSYSNAALNISTDLAFSIFIPIPMLWNVQMNTRQKASLICILGLGIFATAAAVGKVSYVANYGRSGDWLWDSRNLTIWTVAECNVGIVAGNLPCLKPIFRRILGSSYGRGSRASRKASQPYLSDDAYAAGSANPHSHTTSGAAAKYYAVASPRDAYMLTTIDAGRDHNASVAAAAAVAAEEKKFGHGGSGSRSSASKSSSSGRNSPIRQSTEKIISSTSSSAAAAAAAGQSKPAHNYYTAWGRIAVTTDVDVSESRSIGDGDGDGDRDTEMLSQREAKYLV